MSRDECAERLMAELVELIALDVPADESCPETILVLAQEDFVASAPLNVSSDTVVERWSGPDAFQGTSALFEYKKPTGQSSLRFSRRCASSLVEGPPPKRSTLLTLSEPCAFAAKLMKRKSSFEAGPGFDLDGSSHSSRSSQEKCPVMNHGYLRPQKMAALSQLEQYLRFSIK
jgi:hypothetical protein